jgi:hypothetical protein
MPAPFPPIVKGMVRWDFQDFAKRRPAMRRVCTDGIDYNTGKPFKTCPTKEIPGKFIYHKGLDIGNRDGLSWPVYCPVVGWVVWVNRYYKDESWWPAQVVIQDALNPAWFHRFGHLDHRLALQDPKVVRGKVVNPAGILPGQLIGRTAATSTLRRISPTSGMESHLHYEVFRNYVPGGGPPSWPGDYCDPLHFLKTGQYVPGGKRVHGLTYPVVIS